MKTIRLALASALAVTAGWVFAEGASTNAATKARRQRTPEEMKALAESYMMRRHGGTIRKPGSARGRVLFVNAQTRVTAAGLKAAFDEIDSNIHPDWVLKEVESVKLSNPSSDIKRLGGNVGIVLADAPDHPALVVAPEDGWAVVNVAALAEGADAVTLASRVRKELLRAFALAGGCSFMARGGIVLRADVRTPRDLDSIREESYGVDALNTLNQQLPYYGVMPWIQTTYKKACREGWAPAPTNEFQKAIWDKVHAIPKNPMKIEFNPKKGR